MKIIGQLKAILGLDKSQYDRGLNQAEKQATGFGNTIKKIGGWIAAAFGIGVLVNFGKQAVALAAKLEGVESAFKKLGQPSLLADLRKATRGTVDDLTLMQKAVQAKNFKIPLSQLATYFEFATNRAIQTGEAVDYLVDSIITGIGRKSVLVMDNLGISAVELQDEVKKTGDFGSAAGNIIRRELTSMGSVSDTTATKFAKMATSWENFKTSVGEFVTRTPIFAKALDAISRVLSGPKQVAVNDPYAAWRNISKEQAQDLKKQTEDRIKYLKENSSALVNEEHEIEFLTEGLKVLDDQIAKTDETIGKQTKTIADLRTEIDNYKQALEEVSITDNKHRLEILQKTYALEKQLEALTTLKTQIEKLEKLPTGQIKPSVSGGPVAGPGLQGVDVTATSGEQARASMQAMTEELQNQSLAVDILSGAFDSLFTSVDGGFKAMIESIIGSIKRLIAELMARVAVLTILNILTGGGAKFGAILKTAAGSMGITKMASGGTVPPGYPNDTFPAMLTSGEKVIPKGSAGRFGEKIQVEVTGTILNRDISVSGRRSQREN